jgi:hypothetical protein
VLTVWFTVLFTALSALCAAYVVKAMQFYRARLMERRKLSTTPSGKLHLPSPDELRAFSEQRAAEEESESPELEALVRATSSRPWWLAFQARCAAAGAAACADSPRRR